MPVYCVTSAQKDDRYRAPPPTPPGYLGIPLVAVKEGATRHPRLKPPDYSVALQRSKLVPPHCAIARQPEAGIHAKTLVQSPTQKRQDSDPRLANVNQQREQASEEDGTCCETENILVKCFNKLLYI